jgi:hypothetical protein
MGKGNVLRKDAHTDDHRWKRAEEMKDQLNRQPGYMPGISILEGSPKKEEKN